MNCNTAARFRLCFLLTLALVSLLGAWSYEQIEGPGNWAWIELEVMPNGTICICYQNSTTGEVWLSRKDTTWHADSLGCWQVRGGHHLAPYQGSRPAVLLSDDSVFSFALAVDSGWTLRTYHGVHSADYAYLAFDSSGSPALALSPSSIHILNWVEIACLRDTNWVYEVLAYANDTIAPEQIVHPTDFRLGAQNKFCVDWDHIGSRGPFRHACFAYGRIGEWTVDSCEGWSVGLAPSPESSCAFCYDEYVGNNEIGFYCDGDSLDSPAYPDLNAARLRVDALGRRQIVYRCPTSGLKHAYNTGMWHIETLPAEINAATAFDFATDQNALPLIAFIRDSSIFLATGSALGAAETKPPTAEKPLRIPSIVRGALELPPNAERRTTNDELLDLTGRKVLDLHSGPNDVSRLAPGVYFISQRRTRNDERRTIKVVIQN